MCGKLGCSRWEHLRNIQPRRCQRYHPWMIARRVLSILFFAAAAFSQQDSNADLHSALAEPQLPVIDENVCPFEGCTFGKWKVAKESTVYSSWKDDRAQIAKLSTGQEVTGLTGVHITRKPDRILVKRDLPNLGLKRGDVVLRYMYIGEGFANVWAGGKWHKEEDCSFISEKDGMGCLRDCAAVVIENGVKEWWVQIKTADGKIGWVRVQNNFEGMDSLA